MSTKHTPGPWRDGRGPDGKYIVCQMNHDTTIPAHEVNEEWQANSRLCDAAPDLLEALEECARIVDIHVIGCDAENAVERANAAIAKATGGAL